jgi:hypothetical protein
MKTLLNTAAVISLSFTLASAQSVPQTPAGGPAVPVKMVVTAEALYGSAIPPINRADIRVLREKTDLPVTEWISLQGDRADLELYVLIDEKINPNVAPRIEEIRRFVLRQPVTTAVGIAYMHKGEAKIAQAPTRDHASAAKALRPPSGNVSAEANPFTSLSALINGWHTESLRREVLVVTDGVDIFENVGYANMFVDIAVEDAQRAGVQVFCFYAPGAGHSGHSPALIRGGQAYLAELAEQTGGEAYFNVNELEPSPSFDPYLTEVARHLAHQYRITFLATPVAGHAFQRVTFPTPLPNVEVTSAHGFYLDAEALRP